MAGNGQRRGRRRSLAVIGAAGVLAAVLTLAQSAEAGPGDGILTVVVHRDFSGDGVYDAAYDPPQAGITVAVTDGTSTQTLVTGASGEAAFDLSTFDGSSFRIDASIDDADLAHLQPAPAATATTANAFRAFTSFVDGSSRTVRLAVWNPDTYTTRNPQLALAQQISRFGPSTHRSVMVTDWNNRGPENLETADNTAGFRTIATQAETGTVFGMAWDHRADHIYSAAYAKAHTLYGPGGSGGIYRSDATGTGPGVTELWATVPNAGTSVHQTENGYDDPFFLANGREGLGGLALSEDGSALYAVNLNDRSLYTYDTSQPAPATHGQVIPIGDPGCAPSGAWRPFAVTVRDGDVYVGGVCDASTSLARSDLTAHVLRLDGGTFTSIFQQTLDFAKGDENFPDPIGNLSGPNVSTHWNAWRTSWDADLAEYLSRGPMYPVPMLTSFQFENDGSIVFSFRDRTPDAVVRNGYSPDPDNRTNVTGMMVGGDINKACLVAGSYHWEGTASCPNNHTATNSGGEPADRVQYFPGDFFLGSFNYGTDVKHQETSMGGLALAPREPDVANTSMNPSGLYNTGGIGFFDRVDGTGPGNSPHENGLLVAGNTSFNFGKGSGLGDLALRAEVAPVQIGNRVWFDADRDGEQDASDLEPGVPGATVRLLAADGVTVLATTTTDENGEYYFGGEGGFPLEPGVDYVIEFDITTIDPSLLPGTPTLDQLGYTIVEDPDAGTDHDSNAVPQPGAPPIGRATVTAPEPGGVDHSIDAGINAYGVDIEKGDSGSEAAGPIVNDADTSGDGQGYVDGESRSITFELNNSAGAPLYNVSVTDEVLGGDVAVVDLTCWFPGEAAPTAGTSAGGVWTVHWAATFGDASPEPVGWQPGVEFACSATLTLAGGDVPHLDRAVVHTNVVPSGTPGDADQDGPTDEDDYVAFTGSIQVIKYDGNLADPDVGSGPSGWTPPTKPLVDPAQDANTSDDAVAYPIDDAQRVRWVITNTGATWLADIGLADITDAGPDIGAWTCDLSPVGGPSDHSFVQDGPWAGPLAPGASFFCEGPLSLPAETLHADTVEVEATVVVPVLDADGEPVLDQDGVPTYETDGGEPVRSDLVVGDDDPFHAETGEDETTTTTTTTTSTTTTTAVTTTPPSSGTTVTNRDTSSDTSRRYETSRRSGSSRRSGPRSLPGTGSDQSQLVVAAFVLIVGGASLVVGCRRRASVRDAS